jgi:nitrogenase molybdenum-iron protein alpha/beta subunit
MTTELDVRLGFSYSIGLYLAVNAVPDALLVMDGKDCVVQKTSQIQGNHDWHSTLTSSDGSHRVLTTHAMPEDVWKGRQADVERVLRYAVARGDIGVVLLGALRMASITEPQYDMILERFARDTGTTKPLVLLPTRSREDDWIAGYADTLAALARALPLSQRLPSDVPRVGIVGYLLDRNEEDHGANLRELRRLIEGIGARLVSVWLGGESTKQLAAIGEADVLVAMPYARQAGQILAERTGARLVEGDLPMGLGGTSRWLQQVALALRTEEQAQAFVDRELAHAAPKLEWVVSLLLAGQSMAFLGDPHLMRGFLDMAKELGIRVPFRAIWAASREDQDDLRDDPLDDPVVFTDPREGQMSTAFDRVIAERNVRLVVANSYALLDLSPKIAAFELGYPSFHAHALTDQPFLGYTGCLSLVGRLTERLKLHELLAPPLPPPG